MNPQRPTGQRAFSLVEMLITVAIIVALAAMLLPAFKSVLERGKNGLCVGRLRAIGAGLHAYTADNDGKLIPYASMNGATWFWFDELNPYMDIPETDTNRTQPYPWQLCPSKPVTPENRQTVGYGWSRMFGFSASDHNDGGGIGNRRVNQVTMPGRTIIIADSTDIPNGDGNIPAISDNRYLWSDKLKTLARRHSGRGNYLMVDGHVAIFKPEEIITPPTQGRGFTLPWWGINQKN